MTPGKPLRVIRGPKLQGGHGTADAGGGYRYDGLYKVAAQGQTVLLDPPGPAAAGPASPAAHSLDVPPTRYLRP